MCQTGFVEIQSRGRRARGRVCGVVVSSSGSLGRITRRDTPREQSIQSSEGGRPSHEPRGRYLSHTRCAIGPGRSPGGKTREPN